VVGCSRVCSRVAVPAPVRTWRKVRLVSADSPRGASWPRVLRVRRVFLSVFISICLANCFVDCSLADRPPGRRGPSARHQLLADHLWTRYGPSVCCSVHLVVLLRLTDHPPMGSTPSAQCPRTVRPRLADRPSDIAQDC
jgi:hypothetical protein